MCKKCQRLRIERIVLNKDGRAGYHINSLKDSEWYEQRAKHRKKDKGLL
jgi:hypothetical protein